jgi:hypothetical protein
MVSRVMTGLYMAVFVVVCLLASPVILFKFGVDWVREWIEARWPDSRRALVISFWIGLLAPVLLNVVLVVLLLFAVARLRIKSPT